MDFKLQPWSWFYLIPSLFPLSQESNHLNLCHSLPVSPFLSPSFPPIAGWMLGRQVFTGASKQRTLSHLPTPLSPPISILPPSVFFILLFPCCLHMESRPGKAYSCSSLFSILCHHPPLLLLTAKNTGIHQSHERIGRKISFFTFGFTLPLLPTILLLFPSL